MGRRIAIELFLMAAAGLVFGIIGPFGTFATPIVPRIAYWVLMIVAGYPIFRGLGVVARWLSEATAVPVAITLMLALTIAALPMVLIVAALFMRVDPLTALNTPGIALLYAEVWVIGLVVHGAMTLLLPRTAAVDAPVLAKVEMPSPVANTSPAPPALPLSPGFGPLLALKAEDHYLRAISAARDELFLMRLRDAVAMLPADAGVQVHRSWWVAKDAVTQVARDGRTAMLTLSNGAEVPVSRDRMAAVKDAGWSSKL